jgi:hypothetical protein
MEYEQGGSWNSSISLSQYPFELFSKGHGRSTRNIIRQNKAGRNVLIFDFTYNTTSGTDANGHQQTSANRQTVCLIEDQHLRLPQFVMRPQGFFDQFGSLFGTGDIDFHDNPGFSSAYYLTGSNEADIRTVFNSRTVSYFENHQGWYIEGLGNRILVCRKGHLMQSSSYSDFYHGCMHIADLFADRPTYSI